MFGGVIDFLIFLIFLIVLCLVVALILWAVQRFFPDIFVPAKYIVGALALIALLYKLKPLILGGLP